MTDRYGKVRVIKIREAFNELREACRDEGTDRIQNALDRYEPWAAYVLTEKEGAAVRVSRQNE